MVKAGDSRLKRAALARGRRRHSATGQDRRTSTGDGSMWIEMASIRCDALRWKGVYSRGSLLKRGIFAMPRPFRVAVMDGLKP